MIFTAKDLKMIMWEKTELPENELVESNGKKEWKKTDKTVEKTTYTFRSIAGEKLILLANNEHRKLEGLICDVDLDISFNEFQRKNKISLSSVLKSESGVSF